MNLGDGLAANKSMRQLGMNKWYHIKISRKDKVAELSINQTEKTRVKAPKNYKILNIGNMLYFGGVEKITTR